MVTPDRAKLRHLPRMAERNEPTLRNTKIRAEGADLRSMVGLPLTYIEHAIFTLPGSGPIVVKEGELRSPSAEKPATLHVHAGWRLPADASEEQAEAVLKSGEPAADSGSLEGATFELPDRLAVIGGELVPSRGQYVYLGSPEGQSRPEKPAPRWMEKILGPSLHELE